jgi:hypothetical protein
MSQSCCSLPLTAVCLSVRIKREHEAQTPDVVVINNQPRTRSRTSRDRAVFAEALRRAQSAVSAERLAKQMSEFVEFVQATFRAGIAEAEKPREEAGLFGSPVYRPAVFRRNGVGWVATCSWRSGARGEDLVAFKAAKRTLDQGLIEKAGALMATLARQLYGDRPADGITCVPCGHSLRADCFGKRLARAVADCLLLPFVQVHADRFCSGVSHPKEYRKLPRSIKSLIRCRQCS